MIRIESSLERARDKPVNENRRNFFKKFNPLRKGGMLQHGDKLTDNSRLSER
jgi:hypothetical protein